MTDFEQPKLADADKPATEEQKTDALTAALQASRAPKPVDPALEPKKMPGKFALDYTLKGVPIRETHATIPHALASVARLANLGIVPKTSTL